MSDGLVETTPDSVPIPVVAACGKAGCHCMQGNKHVSLYLSTKVDGKRRMFYIPPELEEEVYRCVAAYREAQALTATVSEACMNRVLEAKRGRTSDG